MPLLSLDTFNTLQKVRNEIIDKKGWKKHIRS